MTHCRCLHHRDAGNQSAANGDAIIQWANADEGATDWALCSIKGGDPVVRWGKTLSNWHNAGGNSSYVDVNPCENQGGDNVETDKTIRVFLPRHGRDEDPNVVADEVIPFIMTDPTADPQRAVCNCEYLDGKINVSLRMIVATADTPDGWENVDAADGRTVAFNSDPPVEGYDHHGETENNHDEHPDHDDHINHDDHYLNWIFQHSDHPQPTVTVLGTSFETGDKGYANAGRDGEASISGWNGSHSDHELLDNLDHNVHSPHSPHEPHTDTSNWPPWYRVKLIKRIDNSA